MPIDEFTGIIVPDISFNIILYPFLIESGLE